MSTSTPTVESRIAALEATVARHAAAWEGFPKELGQYALYRPWVERTRAILHPPAPPPIDPEDVIGEPKLGLVAHYIRSKDGLHKWDSSAGKWIATGSGTNVTEVCRADAIAIRARLVRDRVLPPGTGGEK